jgi:endonuclease/exonuclease/phosphatase family metal-dependent hydrolase
VRLILTLLLTVAACNNKLYVPSGPDTRLLVAPPLATCAADAPPLTTVRVVTWNMDAAQLSPLGDIATVLANSNADIILLQEVDYVVQRTGNVNEPEQLAKQLSMSYVFAETMPWQNGHYGVAMLSRLPIAGVERIALDASSASERRIGLDLTLCLGPVARHVVNLHADIVSDAGADNVRELLSVLKPGIGKGLLLAGDFNAAPNDAGPEAVLAAGLSDVVAPYNTSPTSGSRRQDLIFADALLAPHARGAHVIATDKSDHIPVVADFAGPF